MITTANKITVLRAAAVPVFMLLAYSGHDTGAFVIYLLACFSDIVDGYIARHYNQVSSFGKFFDPLADKMLAAAVMCFLIEADVIRGWIVAVILFREFAVSGLRLVAVERNTVIVAGVMGKIKTVITMICLAVMLLFRTAVVLNTILSYTMLFITLFSGAVYYFKYTSVLKTE